MSLVNITRKEALDRSRIISVKEYKVLIDLSGRRSDGVPLANPKNNFFSRSKIDFTSTGGRFWVDIIADEIVKLTVDGQSQEPHNYDGYRLWFDLAPGSHQIKVEALCRYSHTGEGLHRFVDPADQRVYLYSQFESADARRMYANFEQPDLKASFRLSVIAKKDWTVISNSPTPTPIDVDYRNARWDFDKTVPIPTYITALCAGEYHQFLAQITSEKGELPASVFCRESVAQYLDGQRIIQTTQRGFEVYERNFEIAYPFEKYDTVFVPEFNFGAMENAGCVTARDEYLFRSKVTAASYEARDNTLLHELAHMWFGNLVTMKWWDDIWLNESFAEWCAYWCQDEIRKAYGGSDPWTGFTNHRKNWAYEKDQLPTTHPIAADMYDLQAVENNFDGITYAKGASTIKQLVAQVGVGSFLAGVRKHLSAHMYSNATLEDLLTALTQTSGRDLSWFTSQWLTQAGVNTISADFTVGDNGVFTSFDVVQTAADSAPTLRNHRIAIGLYHLQQNKLTRLESVEVDISGERTPIASLLGRHRPDLILLNDRDLTYSKVRLDNESLECVINNLAKVPDSATRALLWGICWDMCRDGEIPSEKYVEFVLANIAQESDATGFQTQLSHAKTAATDFTNPNLRPGLQSMLLSGLVRLLLATEPGSDQQLGAANALISVASTNAGVGLLQAWLAGKEVPAGLVIEQDQRWAILRTLASVGAVNQVEIAAEQYRDRSITGEEKAALALASLNTADAKQHAWVEATENPRLANATHRSLCAGFNNYGQEDILAPYQEKYLSLVADISAGEGIWKDRGFAASSAALELLFPLPNQDFIKQLDSFLSDHELVPWVSDIVSDNRDFALRALHAQQNHN